MKGEGGRGWRGRHTNPSPTRRSRSRHREGHLAREAGALETEEQVLKGADEGAEEDGETPRGTPVEVQCVGGGMPPPQRKTQTSWDSPQNVRTCCCRESIETSRITTTGRTWTGELQTTLHGSVAVAGSLLNQRAGTPHPLERWGAASRRSWRQNGGG